MFDKISTIISLVIERYVNNILDYSLSTLATSEKKGLTINFEHKFPTETSSTLPLHTLEVQFWCNYAEL